MLVSRHFREIKWDRRNHFVFSSPVLRKATYWKSSLRGAKPSVDHQTHDSELCLFVQNLLMDFICFSKISSLEHCLNYSSYTEAFYEKKRTFLVHRVHLNSVLNCKVYNTYCPETPKKSKQFQREWHAEINPGLQELTLVKCFVNSCHKNNSKSLVFSPTFYSFLVIIFARCSNSPW